MRRPISRTYVFKVTVVYMGISPKPDAHQLRQFLMAALMDSKFPKLGPGRFSGGSSVSLQVQCTGRDRKIPGASKGIPARRKTLCAGSGSYGGHPKRLHDAKLGCTWSLGEQLCWCKKYVSP